jgi:chromosomal replication initiator protein
MKEWEQFLSNLEQELSPAIIDQWLRPLKVLRFDAANLYLEAKEPMLLSWFEEHIRPKLKKNGFFNENNRPIKVHLGSVFKKKPFFAEKQIPITFTPRSLDPACTFENFSTASGNLMAYKLFAELANSGSSFFNPIYLYGPKGCGKTHLLMAAATQLSHSKKVFYTTADAFTDHVVQAIRAASMPALRKIYRDIDVLIVEDVDRFGGRMATQEEFFHTFNALHTMGKQIILSSQFPPSKLQDIESRLISRFEWGIAVGMEKTDLSQVLKQKAIEWNFPLEKELLDFLLAKFPIDPIIALQALTLRMQTKDPISTTAAAHILKDLIEKEASKARTPDGVVKMVATHFGIKKEDVLGKAQSKEIALPRKIAMYVCREVLKMPFQAIGKFFDRDHSTVMSSVKQMQGQLDAKNEEILEATAIASRVKD